MSNPAPILLWFRHDLRLRDHPALRAAVDSDRPVLPVYIWCPEEEEPWAPGAASQWWLHQSLGDLSNSLNQAESRLILRAGPALDTLRDLIRETGATSVYWSRRYEPASIQRDKTVKAALREDGIEAESFNASLLFEPWTVQTGSGTPYKVFTPFWRKVEAGDSIGDTVARPRTLPAPDRWPDSEDLSSFELEPKMNWAGGIAEAWTPGESGARAELRRFLNEAIDTYDVGRDTPGRVGTSRLSPHLHFGEISPREIWNTVREKAADGDIRDGESWLRQLVWREFGHHLLYHFPHTERAPLRPEFEDFPWRDDPGGLRAWQRGQTGFPIVDAGMRELWTSGWMHNRVRMIVASFLIKDLLIPWQRGAEWFWDTLVDADLANNTMGWQWTAGCGADASPFFRVFNPMSQGEKFDPDGDYVRRWVPELAELPRKWLHRPWEAPPDVLSQAGVSLGDDYPTPIVDHAAARKRALAALGEIR